MGLALKPAGEGHMNTKGKRKSLTVAAIAEEAGHLEPSPPITIASREERAGGQRAHVKQLTLYLPHPVYRQLRELAFHEEKRMHSLLLEGLDRVFADRGARSIDQITRES
jgi:hypothetical protein